MSFRLSILTPEGGVYEGEADSVMAPGWRGFFGVLSGHAPMLSAIHAGILRVQLGGEKRFFVVGGGVAEICQDRVTVLADVVQTAEDEADAEERVAVLLDPSGATVVAR